MPSISGQSYMGSKQARDRHEHSPPSSPLKSKRRPEARRPHRQQNGSDDERLSFYVNMGWQEAIRPAIGFVCSVLALIWSILRPCLTVLVAVWVILYIFRYLLTSTVSRSVTPLCSLPGVSYLGLPFCRFGAQPAGPVEFDQLMTVQSEFEGVLASSSGGVTLPLDMKRSESSIRDLKHVVQYSSLPSRNELVFEFGGFIDTARQAAADLTRFNSRVGRAVDHVISTNRWTLQVLDGVAEKAASHGSIAKLLAGTVLFPFQTSQVTEHLLMEQYLRHTGIVEEQIAQLIVEAHSLLGILDNLDQRLDTIHDISTRDGVLVKGSRDDLLAQLWTKLGGNRSSKKKHNDQLYLLQRVGAYRKTAWEHVSGTVLKLQSMAAGLEDLRERVAVPEVLGPRDDVPLRLHIDNIQMAVERLDQQRTDARKLEGDHQRRMLNKGDQLLLS